MSIIETPPAEIGALPLAEVAPAQWWCSASGSVPR